MGLFSFIVRVAANALALWLAASFVDGFGLGRMDFNFVGFENLDTVAPPHDTQFWISLAVVALVFTLVNMLVRPVVKLLSLPLIILTLGLFLLVVNALMVMLTGWISTQLSLGLYVNGFWPALWAGIVIALVNWVIGLLIPTRNDGGRR